MPDFIPLDTFKFSINLFSLLIINSYHVVFSSCRKSAAISFIINCQNVIVIFTRMKNLFSILPHVLINVSIGICNKKDWAYCFAIFIYRPPLYTVDRAIMFLLWRRIEIMQFFTCVYVEYIKLSVTVSCSYKLVFIAKLCCHQLCWMRVYIFDKNFSFVVRLFDDPEL